MKNKFVDRLMDEIEFIDDDIILSAATCKQKKKFPFKKVLSLAACFVVLCVGSFFGYKTIFSRDNVTDEIKGSPDYYENSNKNDDAFVGETFPNYSDKFYGNDDFEGVSSGESLRDEDLSANDAADKNFSSNDIYMEEGSEGDEWVEEEDENDFFSTNVVPSFSSKIIVDDLNKLAYFSGWKILKEQGALNSKKLFELNRLEDLNPLKKVVYVNEGFGVDTSEMDVSVGFEIDSSSEYVGVDEARLEIVFSDVKQLTVNSVEYFRILITEKSFLANKIGVGNAEVMILDVVLENNVSETMIVFRNSNNYFSCFLVDFDSTNNNTKEFVFSPSRFASNYNVVKNPELENNTFEVIFTNDGSDVSEICFNENNNSISLDENISLQTYNYVNDIKVSNTVYSLNCDLYDIYIRDFANTETSLPPEKIEDLEKPDVSDDFEYIGHNESVSCIALFQGDGKFLGDIGYEILTTDNKDLIEDIFPNDDFSQFLKSASANKEYIVLWVRGNARHSSSEFVFAGDYIEFNFEYVLFQDYTTFADFSVFVFEKDKLSTEISKVVVNAVEYSTTVTAVFTTDNEYDYGIKNEDEYEIYTFSNCVYQLYKNGELIYESEYKVSYGYICLVVDEDVLYLELSPYASFVYPLDDFNRIFKLI